MEIACCNSCGEVLANALPNNAVASRPGDCGLSRSRPLEPHAPQNRRENLAGGAVRRCNASRPEFEIGALLFLGHKNDESIV